METYKRPLKKSDNIKPQSHIVRDSVLLGDWKEVQGVDAQTIKPDLAPETLNGLIIKGYEMKFGETNKNGERYEPTAFDDFIKSYFVDGGFNMPVDINHEGAYNWHAYCGRVLYIEVNSVGFYFAVYVPRTYPEYDRLKWALQSGIVQGFSKEGYASWEDIEWRYKEDGTFDYELIKKIRIIAVSLVCTPANGVQFEQMKETRNALVFANKTEEDKPRAKSLAEMFNKNK